jgi:hypothetical protein
VTTYPLATQEHIGTPGAVGGQLSMIERDEDGAGQIETQLIIKLTTN